MFKKRKYVHVGGSVQNSLDGDIVVQSKQSKRELKTEIAKCWDRIEEIKKDVGRGPKLDRAIKRLKLLLKDKKF